MKYFGCGEFDQPLSKSFKGISPKVNHSMKNHLKGWIQGDFHQKGTRMSRKFRPLDRKFGSPDGKFGSVDGIFGPVSRIFRPPDRFFSVWRVRLAIKIIIQGEITQCKLFVVISPEGKHSR